jgi:hypothetical protein
MKKTFGRRSSIQVELHRHALTDPYVNLSTHTTLVIHLLQIHIANEQRDDFPEKQRF